MYYHYGVGSQPKKTLRVMVFKKTHGHIIVVYIYIYTVNPRKLECELRVILRGTPCFRTRESGEPCSNFLESTVYTYIWVCKFV